MADEKGLVIVFTGDGKGKTTAALGIALRALGRGQRTLVLQFMKGRDRSGEQLLEESGISLITVRAFGAGFFRKGDDPTAHMKAATEGWRAAKEELASGTADILVLDEISHAVNSGLIPKEPVIEALRGRRDRLHVVLTGRNMPRDLANMADILTNMDEIRHTYHTGKGAVEGIDY
jgi:cob(I)alamin adenosyltransferase